MKKSIEITRTYKFGQLVKFHNSIFSIIERVGDFYLCQVVNSKNYFGVMEIHKNDIQPMPVK